MNLIIQPALLQYQNRGEVKERILIFIHNEISKQVVYYINNTIFPISYNVNRNLENFLKKPQLQEYQQLFAVLLG